MDGIDEQLQGNTFYRCAARLQGKPRKSPRGPLTSLKHKRKRYKTPKHKTPHIPDEKQIIETIDDIFIPNSTSG